jgi:hypothetical protein
MIKNMKSILILGSLTLLTACGGGGSSSADPQGYWSGPSSTGYNVNAVVLNNGETWGIYSSGNTIYGALYGKTLTNGNSVSITGTDFNFLTNSASAGNLTGLISAKSSMSLSGSGVTLPLTYQSAYDTAASASSATGTWSFVGRSGGYSLIPGSITIDGAGRFILNQTNCVTTGTIIPRSGGKNVYDTVLASVGSGCAVGQSSLSGVTYIDTTVTPNKILSLALTSDKSDGLIVIATKQ